MKKQILAGILSATMVVGMGGVSVFAADKADDKTYNIGICQLVQHEALDAATQGFKDAITEELGDKVTFDEQNAQGDSNTCSTIITDFVSKNDSFIAMAKAAAELIAKHNPADIDALGALAYEQDGFGPTLEEVRKGLIGKIGENMSFRRFKRFDGSELAAYLHGSRIGVLVAFEGDAAAAKDVAMHIAAMKPVALTSAEVPADLIEKERSVAAAKAEESGKPAEIAAKMVEGAVQKYLKEVSLADQVFVKAEDGKQTVGAMLKAKNTTIKAFTLYVVGEGIEKKADDFAAEVAAQMAAAKGA